MMFKILDIIWVYIVPIIAPYVIYLLSSEYQFNFTIIPKEYVFDLNVAMYSSLLFALFKILDKCIVSQKEKFSCISVIASSDKKNFINRDIELPFRSEYAKVFFQIKLKGKPDRLKKKQISIFFPPQVIVQLTKDSKKYCVYNESRHCVQIEVIKLFNPNKKELISSDSATFDLEFSKADEFVDSSIEVSLTKGDAFSSLEKNKVSFK